VAALASVLPRDARLEGLSIDYQHGGLLELAVEAREAAAWDRLLDRLSRDPRFDDVRPGPESRDAEVKSTVRARWAGGSR
jgi:Tfp pilus assembly protein PilN